MGTRGWYPRRPIRVVRYRLASMATSRSRRAGVRRALLILVVAVVAAIGTIAFGPVLPIPARPGGIAVTATPNPSSGAPSPGASTPGVPSASPSLRTPSPSPSPSSDPFASPLPSASVGPPASGDPVASPPVGVPPDAIPPDPLPPLTPATRIALQARLDQLRLRYGIPGISVSILFPGGARWIGTSGLADVATGEPVTASTGFAVASITKTFTSALVLALVEDGRIDLDATVRTYLPDLKPVGPMITVRQLLDHTSGLRDYFFHARIDQMLLEKRGARWDLARVTRFIGKPYFQPGKGWHYSNTNYLVLGVLAETVGGASLEDQFRDRFFEPLGLRDTWYQLEATPPSFVAHGYRFAAAGPDATPIDLTDGSAIVPFTSVVTAAAGAGGIASSASDLSRWARALYGGDVLGPQARSALVDPSATRRFKPSVPYGLGAQVIDIDGRRTYGHSGRLLGFRAALRYLPDHDLSIAVVTNQSRADPAVILRALLKIAFAPPLPTPEAASPQPPVVVP